MENFKYINNVSADVAEIRIYKRIGSGYDDKGNYIDGVNGSDFANEMAYLSNNSKKINIRINSGGGSVLDALAIQASIINSKIPCDTYIDGIAASAAFSIAVSGRKCYMIDNGIAMVHNAVDESNKADKKVIAIFNESVATTLTNRSGKTNDEIVSMMSKETWMNAKECLDNKMIDGIISTEKNIKPPKVTNVYEMEKIYNEFLKPDNMKNINAALKISNDATEADALTAIAAKDANIAELTNKVTALETEKNTIVEAAKLALTNKATALVNKAFEEKKIKEDEKAGMLANASSSESNYEFVKNMLDKIGSTKPATLIFDPSKVKNQFGGQEDRSAWTYRDWETKDSAGLGKIQNEAPELFTQLYNSYYKK